MIERWLQITCDSCGETDNSTAPDMTIIEFREKLGQVFVRYKKRDLCRTCFLAVTSIFKNKKSK